MNVTRCTGEGQGSCRRCEKQGRWNRNWMSLLFRIEWLDGCYCYECMKQIVKGDGQTTRYQEICKAINIKPYQWQMDYATTGAAIFPKERQSGRTTAIMLHTLLLDPQNAYELFLLLSSDPDFHPPISQMVWYYNHYTHLVRLCRAAGIELHHIERQDFVNEITRREW